MLAEAYRIKLQPYLTVLPVGARHNATVSIAETQVIAGHLGPAGARLMTAASTSFVDAMHVTALISVLIAAIGAVTIGIWMPGRKAGASRAGHPVAVLPAAESATGAGALDA